MSQLRAAQPGDSPTVARLIHDAFAAPARRFGITSPNCPVHPSAYDLASLSHDISLGRRFFVLEQDGRIVGSICLRILDDGSAELSRVAVHPSAQRHGVGSQLLEQAIAQAASAGAAQARIFIFARYGELLGWYQRRGFLLVDTLELNDVPTPVAEMVRPIVGRPPAYMRMLGSGDEPMLERLLLEHVESSAMLLSNLRKGGIVDNGRSRQATYWGAFNGSELTGVIALCWNGTILAQAPDMLDPLARTLAATAHRPITAIVGLDTQVSRIAHILGLPSGRETGVLMDSREFLYVLPIPEMRLPASYSRYNVRRVENRDVPLLTDWMIEFNIEAMNRRLSRAEVEANLVGMAEERDNRWVLESSAGLLATTGFNAETREVVQVGGVYTPPELRNRGYARCAVAGSLLEAKANGVPLCVLFTARDNIAAQRAYEALGFRKRGDYRLLFFSQEAEPRLSLSAG